MTYLTNPLPSPFSQEEPADMTYVQWQADLMRVMRQLAKDKASVTSGGAMIDNMVPFRLGWSAERSARAFLFLAPEDYRTLKELTTFREWMS